MNADEYLKLAEVEDRMWYFRSLHGHVARELGRFLPQGGQVLDAGCGTGGLILRLREANPAWHFAGIDFMPLTVNYTEKYYAAGRIPGGYFKRERGPTEKDTLTSRLIDRPIRPLFPDGWRCDTQVTVTVMSHDQENDPDIVALVATSAALTLSGIPFMGPIGAARVGFSNNEYVLNPTIDEMKETKLDLVVAGTSEAVLMVESEAQELSEEVMLGAVMFGHRHFQPVINAIIQLAEKCAKEPREFAVPDNAALEKEMLGLVEADLRKAYSIPKKAERYEAVGAVKKKAMAHYFPDGKDNPERPMTLIGAVFKELEAKIVRWNILDTKKRIDGRDLVTVRPILAEVGILPRAHGSSLFTRGETQAMVVATLGTADDEQFIDALEGTFKETFLLHYNFPPYSVGETGRMGSPGRREIGHGKLAWSRGTGISRGSGSLLRLCASKPFSVFAHRRYLRYTNTDPPAKGYAFILFC